MRFLSPRTLFRALVLGVVTLCAACTTATVTPLSMEAPPQAYKSVLVGQIDSRDPTFAALVPFFRQGLVRRLRELNAFNGVSDAPGTTVSSDTILVSGTVTEIDKGSAALRIIIGMGAGREHASAEVNIQSPDGKSLARFVVRKAYSGGVGIGGGGFIDMEDLTAQLGEQAAQSIVDWAQGKPVAFSS